MEKRKILKDFDCEEKLYTELREEVKKWIVDLWETPHKMGEGGILERAHLETLREVEGAKKVLELFFSLGDKKNERKI